MQRRVLVVMLVEMSVMLAAGVLVFFASQGGMPESQMIVIVVVAVAVSFLFSTVMLTMILLPRARLRGLKQTGIPALAEVLEDPSPKYRNGFPGGMEFGGALRDVQVKVRVQRGDMLPYEAKLWVGQSEAACIRRGVRLQVRCHPVRTQWILLDDTAKDIIQRNGL